MVTFHELNGMRHGRYPGDRVITRRRRHDGNATESNCHLNRLANLSLSGTSNRQQPKENKQKDALPMPGNRFSQGLHLQDSSNKCMKLSHQ